MRTHIVASLLLTSGLIAQSVVVPNGLAAPSPLGLNTLLRNAANPRTYQYGVNAAQLAGIPIGSPITGISLRMYNGTVAGQWPAAQITWTDYDISVGPAIPTASWTGNPTTNFSSPPQVVRNGPMTLDAQAFVSNGTAAANPWSEFYFDFQTPYVYTGGDLGMLFSHPGSSDPLAPQFPEAVAPAAGTHGVSFSQAVFPAGTAMVSANFYVMRIHYGYGAGCVGGSGTAPVMVQNGDTTGGLGGNISFTLANAPANSLILFGFGFTQLAVPIGNGCTLLTSPDVTLAGITNANGRAVQNVGIPPGLVASFFAQGAVLDPGAPGGITLTNGVSPSAN